MNRRCGYSKLTPTPLSSEATKLRKATPAGGGGIDRKGLENDRHQGCRRSPSFRGRLGEYVSLKTEEKQAMAAFPARGERNTIQKTKELQPPFHSQRRRGRGENVENGRAQSDGPEPHHEQQNLPDHPRLRAWRRFGRTKKIYRK